MATPGGDTDGRNHGLRRTYFYRRKRDGYVFPLDNELQAHHLLRRKDFNDKFEFMGWSDGAEYKRDVAEIEKGFREQIEKEIEERQLDFDAAERYQYRRMAQLTSKAGGKLQEAVERAAKRAQDNPDKTLPRDFRRRDLGGAPLTGPVGDQLNMMG